MSTTVRAPSTLTPRGRRIGVRSAGLIMLIALSIQFALGIGVNLYVTLPVAGHPGHGSWFGNGPALMAHALLGMVLILDAVATVVRSIRSRSGSLVVTSVIGLMALVTAAVGGSSFVGTLGDGYSLMMAAGFAVAVTSYAVHLYLAGTLDRTREGR
jgi:hypothetical protein